MEGAAAALADSTDDKNRLLYALDRGVIAHTSGRPEDSNRSFARAEDYIFELDVTDVSDQASSFLVNDYRIAYKGEDFEKVLVHPFKALNYLALNDPDAALVECRALNNRLVEINERHGGESVYNDDAFARYLSGIIYESQGNRNDALVDYRLADSAFVGYGRKYGTPYPPSLQASLLRLAEAQEMGHLVDAFRERWPDVKWVPWPERRAMAEVVFVLETGQAPVKEQARFDAVAGEEDGAPTVLSIAFPKYRVIPPEVGRSVLRAGERAAGDELVEDVSSIAVKDLRDRYGRVVAKEIARVAAKTVASEQVKQKNEILGFLLNLVNSANEQADLRSWETLPAQFRIARVLVPPDLPFPLSADIYAPDGRKIETVGLGEWTLRPGETLFLYHRTLY